MRVRFEPLGVAIEAQPSERLLDLVDEHPGLGLPTACRAANCGLCVLTVVAGAEWVEPASARERETLRALGAQPAARLGCQLRIRSALDSAAELTLALPARANSPPSQ